MGEIAHLVDDEYVGMGVGGQDMAQPALAGRGGELVDERRC
jgi:hypothetical protein